MFYLITQKRKDTQTISNGSELLVVFGLYTVNFAKIQKIRSVKTGFKRNFLFFGNGWCKKGNSNDIKFWSSSTLFPLVISALPNSQLSQVETGLQQLPSTGLLVSYLDPIYVRREWSAKFTPRSDSAVIPGSHIGYGLQQLPSCLGPEGHRHVLQGNI